MALKVKRRQVRIQRLDFRLETDIRTRALVASPLSIISVVSYTDAKREGRTFDEKGLMQKRHMSGNEVSIREDERWFREGVDVDAVEISDVHG